MQRSCAPAGPHTAPTAATAAAAVALQVDSAAGTLAVNFWWESEAGLRFGGSTDGYYFRRLAQSLVEREKRCLLAEVQAAWQLDPTMGPGSRRTGREGEALQLLERSLELRQQRHAAGAAEAEHPEAEGFSYTTRLLAGLGAPHHSAGDRARWGGRVLESLLQLREERPELAAHLLLHTMEPAAWELLCWAIEEREEELMREGGPPPGSCAGVLRGGCGTGHPGPLPAPQLCPPLPAPPSPPAGHSDAAERVQAECDCLYSVCPDRQELTRLMLTGKQEFARQALRRVAARELQL